MRTKKVKQKEKIERERETKTHDLISDQWNYRGIFDLVAIEFFIGSMCVYVCEFYFHEVE